MPIPHSCTQSHTHTSLSDSLSLSPTTGSLLLLLLLPQQPTLIYPTSPSLLFENLPLFVTLSPLLVKSAGLGQHRPELSLLFPPLAFGSVRPCPFLALRAEKTESINEQV